MNEEKLNKDISKFMGDPIDSLIVVQNKKMDGWVGVGQNYKLKYTSMDELMLVLDKLEIKEFGFEYSKTSGMFFAEAYMDNDFGTGASYRYEGNEYESRSMALASVCVMVIEEFDSYLKENPELILLKKLLKDYNNA